MARTKQTARKSPKKATKSPKGVRKSPVKRVRKSPSAKLLAKSCTPIQRVRNNDTGRCVRVGGRKYKELVRDGKINRAIAKEEIQEKLDEGHKIVEIAPVAKPLKIKKAQKSPAKKAKKSPKAHKSPKKSPSKKSPSKKTKRSIKK